MAVRGFFGDNRFLSNFYEIEIEHEGLLYPSVEHAYQASKSLDPRDREDIASLTSPGAAKQAGRGLSVRMDWYEVRVEVMLELLRLKFEDPELRDLLRRTSGDLVEDNTWGDTFWGMCEGFGENQLGKLLMQVREESAR